MSCSLICTARKLIYLAKRNRSFPWTTHQTPASYTVLIISDSTIDLIRAFVRERDWDKYHTPGNLEHIHEEIADVLIYSIMLTDKLSFDLDDIVQDKMAKNARKYPVDTGD